MATAYPGALDATNNQLRTDISSTDDLDASGKEHDVMHVNAHGAIVAVETKLGTGSSTASTGAVMMGTGSGTSAWDTSPTIASNTAITGTLTIGADGSGHDVTFHSDTAGDALVWDSSAESLTITGSDGQTALAVADGNVTITDKLTVSGGLEAPLGVENKTGNYTMVLADAGKCITMNSGSNYTLTIPANGSVAYPIGTTLTFVRLGSGTLTIAITSDTLSSKDGNKKIAGQYASATAIKTASTTWVLIGSLEA